jgi:hypothetical protein
MADKKHAYPVNGNGGVLLSEGLTKREWFAGMALIGILAQQSGEYDHEGSLDFGGVAEDAFKQAVAMLREAGDNGRS